MVEKEKKHGTEKKWKQEIRELLQELVGGGRTVKNTSISPSLKGGTDTQAKLYDLEGQNFKDFKVGELVELIPTAQNHSLYPYLPVVNNSLIAASRKEMFRLNQIRKGLVVKKLQVDSREFYKEHINWQTNWQIDTPKTNIIHGQSQLLQILLGEEGIIVEIWSPSCDPWKSFIVKKIIAPETSNPS